MGPTTVAGRRMHDWLGWHPIDGRDDYILAIEAEARAAAVAPVLEALRERSKAYHDKMHHYHDGPGYETWSKCRGDPCRADRALLSAPPLRPSGEPEPGGLTAAQRELLFRFWVHYRCGYVGCQIVEQHEHGGGPPMRDMTPEERAAAGLDT